MGEIVPKLPLRRLWRCFSTEFAKGSRQTACQRLKQLPLPLGQVVSNPMGGNIAARKEAHAHCARLLQELGLRAAHPEVPGKLIAGTRDKPIHSYEGVDLEEVWKM